MAENPIKAVALYAERREDAGEEIEGIIRIEIVKLIYADGSNEIDNDAGFTFGFNENDETGQSYGQMIQAVAMKYGVNQNNVKFEYTYSN